MASDNSPFPIVRPGYSIYRKATNHGPRLAVEARGLEGEGLVYGGLADELDLLISDLQRAREWLGSERF